MAFYEKFTNSIPLGHLLYILTTGLFVMLFVPYNFLGDDFFNLLKSPLNYMEKFEFLGRSFVPFGNVSNFANDSVVGFTKILLIILVIGIFFYLVRDLFSLINHIPKALKNRISNEKEKIISESEKQKDAIESIKFAKWARENGYKGYLDYIWSIREITLGLLNASEFLITILLLVSLPCIYFLYPDNFSNWLGLLVFSFCVLIVSGLLYLYHKNKHENFLSPFRKLQDEENKKQQY